MAAVYVARALGVAGFERLFAIKVLHPHLAHEEEFITMFLDEARLAARIRHPNVVPTIDISDTPDAGYFLVMDYIEGDHLGALLQRAFKLGARLPAPASLRVIVDALDGLAAAHNLTDETGRPINLVHRDISPHNIMVSTDGIACITDFGVAKAEVRLSTTREGQFKGKLAYMAPEHASNGEADRRSDLFSMGIILWECLTGRRLFRAENHAATLNKICLEPIPMPSEVDPELAPFDHVLEKALAREPEERFQTAEEFADAIERSADALGGLANQRSVAKLVKEYAAEKIARDESMIRTAIAEIGSPVETASESMRVGVAAEAVTTAPSTTAAPPALDSAAADPAPTETDSSALEEELGGRKSTPTLVIALLTALVVCLGVAALLLRDSEPDVTASPLAPTAAEDTPANPTEGGGAPEEVSGDNEATGPKGFPIEAVGKSEAASPEAASPEGQGPDGTAAHLSSHRGTHRARIGSEQRESESTSVGGTAGARLGSSQQQASAPEGQDSTGETGLAGHAETPSEAKKRPRRKSKTAIDDVLLNPYRQKKQ